MAQHIVDPTPTASMVAHLQHEGYYALTTFETTHNANTREIRLYTNGTVTVLLHIHLNYDCDLYLPARGATMPLTPCPECHTFRSLLCPNPACPSDKTGHELAAIRKTDYCKTDVPAARLGQVIPGEQFGQSLM